MILFQVFQNITNSTIHEGFNSITIQSLCNSTSCNPFYTTLSPGVYRFELWGSQGQSGPHDDGTEVGGFGGYTWGEIKIKTNTTFYLFIGNQYGYNGGGSGGLNSLSENGGSGGGATDIRLINGESLDFQSLSSRILVAGGGGGFGGASRDHYNGGRGINGLHGNPQVTIYTDPIAYGYAGRGGYGCNGSSNGRAGNKHDETSYPSFEKGYDGGNGTFGIGGNGGSIYGAPPVSSNCGPGSGGGGGGGYYGGGGGGGGSGYWGGNGGSGGGGSGFISDIFYQGEIIIGSNVRNYGDGMIRLTYISEDICVNTLPLSCSSLSLLPYIILLSLSFVIMLK